MGELGTSAMELTCLQNDKKRLMGVHLQFMLFILCTGSGLTSSPLQNTVLPDYN